MLDPERWDDYADDPESCDPDAIPHPADTQAPPLETDADLEAVAEELAGLQLRRQHIRAVADRESARLQRRYESLLAAVRDRLEPWAQQHAKGRSMRRIGFLAGWRRKGGGLVANPDAVADYLRARGQEPVLTVDLKATVAAHFDATDAGYVDRSTGELVPPDVLQDAPGTDEFYVAPRRLQNNPAK